LPLVDQYGNQFCGQKIKCALAYLRQILGPKEVGHKNVATGRGVLSL